MDKTILKAITIASLGAIIGCSVGFSSSRYLADMHNDFLMQGRSETYSDGYIDGCASGMRQGGDHRFMFSKNESRYKAEKEYRTGWEQGLQFCREEAQDRSKSLARQKALEKEEHRNRLKKRQIYDDIWEEMRK